MAHRKHYIPLEANPILFTQFIHQLGVSPSFEFQDVLSIDDSDLLGFVPRPVLALILIFPTSDTYEEQKAVQEAKEEEYKGYGDEEPVVWYKQTINNACGLYGILHAVSNGEARNCIQPGSTLARLLEDCLPHLPSGRAKILEDSQEVESAYRTVALQGDSEVPENPEDEVDYHYVCFVKASKNNHIYELDGDKKGPVDHGYCPKDVLDDAGLRILRSYLDREKGGNINFSLLALVHA